MPFAYASMAPAVAPANLTKRDKQVQGFGIHVPLQ